MTTDTEIKLKGMDALVKALGDLQTEKFISLILKEPFDYTKWQKKLFGSTDIKILSQKAMSYRQHKEQE